MSIYRRQYAKPKILYDKLKDILSQVKRRYEKANIVIGGDFNDATPPVQINEVRKKSTKSYTRFNV